MVVLYHPRSRCPFRLAGRVLARQARLFTLSMSAHARQRGVLDHYGANR